MKRLEKIIEMIHLWNQVSGYRYTFEYINNKLYIRSEVNVEAVTKLYGMLQMVRDVITYIRVDEKEYEVELEVLEI